MHGAADHACSWMEMSALGLLVSIPMEIQLRVDSFSR